MRAGRGIGRMPRSRACRRAPGRAAGELPPCGSAAAGITERQAAIAAWTAGEVNVYRLGPGICALPPVKTGSGKSGSPWERMHAAAFRYWACCWAVSGGWFAFPVGRSGRQAVWAEANFGVFVSPGTTWTATFVEVPFRTTSGSGKSVTPCARMQAEYFSAWAPGSAIGIRTGRGRQAGAGGRAGRRAEAGHATRWGGAAAAGGQRGGGGQGGDGANGVERSHRSGSSAEGVACEGRSTKGGLPRP